MKKNKLHRKSNSAIYAQAFKSGHDFVELRAEAVGRDLIAPTQTKDRRRIAKENNVTLKELELEYLNQCKKFVASKPTYEVLSNTSGSASKPTVTLDGHSLNPLQQAKDSSARVVEFRHGYEVMEGLYYTAMDLNLQNKMYQFDGPLYAYNGVLSFKNSSKGSLAKEVKDLNTMASALWKRLKDAHVRNGKSNRLMRFDVELEFKLEKAKEDADVKRREAYAESDEIKAKEKLAEAEEKEKEVEKLENQIKSKEEYAVPVGMLISNEVTINSDRLRNMDGTEIFNQHIHFTLFTDGMLSSTAADDLYAIWDNITGSKYKTDRKAFDFNAAYSATAEDDSITNTLKETTKYLMDPSKWDVLALLDDDSDDMREFKIEVFAEYYNAYTNIKRMKTLGLLRDAMSYISRFAEFENASMFNSSDVLGELMTQLNELKFNQKSKRYEFSHVRLLTDDEIIHENRSYLSKILVPKEYKAALDTFVSGIINDLSNDRDRLYAEYFKRSKFNSTLDDLFVSFEMEEKEAREKLDSMDSTVFSSDEFEKEYHEAFDYGCYDHFVKYRNLKMKQAKALRGKDDYLHRQHMIAIELVGRLCDISLLRKAIKNLVDSGGTKIKYSRDEIDARIFEQRLAFRRAINADPNVRKDVALSNMFYKENGMTLPFDGRDSETVEFYVEEMFEAEEIFDLFRVPEDARPRLSVLLGLVKPDHRTGEYLTQDYILGEELLEATRDYARKNERSLRPSRWGNPFEPLPFSEVGQPDKEAVGV